MKYGEIFWLKAGDGSPFTFTVLTQEMQIANKGLGITTVVFGIRTAGALKTIFFVGRKVDDSQYPSLQKSWVLGTCFAFIFQSDLFCGFTLQRHGVAKGIQISNAIQTRYNMVNALLLGLQV